MDELAVGREFPDLKSLSAAIAQFENNNVQQVDQGHLMEEETYFHNI